MRFGSIANVTNYCLLCGDPQQPSEYMLDGATPISDRDIELRTMDWHGDSDAATFRDVTMSMESRGPNDYDASDIVKRVADARLLIVHKAPVNRAVFEAAEELEIVAAARGGTENVDLDAAADHDVTVLHAPGRNASAVADYAVTFGLAAHRQVPYFTRTTAAGEWGLEFDPETLPRDIERLTVGIIGFGNIGREVAERWSGFGPDLLAYDPYVDNGIIREHDAEPVPLNQLLEGADIISLHVRLTDETAGMIGTHELNRMQSSALIVNTARGGLIDEDALAEALRTDAIGGAALDVFEVEPLPEDHPFLEFDAVLLSPHTAGSTRDAVLNGSRIVARDVAALLDGEEPAHPVH